MNNSVKNSFYFEDFTNLIKTSDKELFKDIYCLLSKDFEYDEILYLTGYKDEVLSRLFSEYSYILNIISLID